MRKSLMPAFSAVFTASVLSIAVANSADANIPRHPIIQDTEITSRNGPLKYWEYLQVLRDHRDALPPAGDVGPDEVTAYLLNAIELAELAQAACTISVDTSNPDNRVHRSKIIFTQQNQFHTLALLALENALTRADIVGGAEEWVYDFALELQEEFIDKINQATDALEAAEVELLLEQWDHHETGQPDIRACNLRVMLDQSTFRAKNPYLCVQVLDREFIPINVRFNQHEGVLVHEPAPEPMCRLIYMHLTPEQLEQIIDGLEEKRNLPPPLAAQIEPAIKTYNDALMRIEAVANNPKQAEPLALEP